MTEDALLSGELEIDARKLLALSEEAPDQVEAIIQMMIDADQDLLIADEEE
jgi:hypothetical protein